VIAFVGFLFREFTNREPIVQLRVLGNRDFCVGTLITGLYGCVLYGTTALLPLFLQTLMGYPALDSGLAVSPRGIGSLVSMIVAGILVRYVDERLMLAVGFAILGYSTILLSRINLQVSMVSIIVPNVLNGFSGGLIFVPLTTMAMGRLRKEQIGNASGIYNLMRNIGGSIGIASVTTLLVRGSQKHQSYLAANITAGSPGVAETLHGLQAKLSMGGVDSYAAFQKALGTLYEGMQRQASLLAYTDDFRLLGCLSLLCIPLALLFHRVRKHSQETLSVDGM
jgi:DHA2 family multidrug resistance protein